MSRRKMTSFTQNTELFLISRIQTVIYVFTPPRSDSLEPNNTHLET